MVLNGRIFNEAEQRYDLEVGKLSNLCSRPYPLLSRLMVKQSQYLTAKSTIALSVTGIVDYIIQFRLAFSMNQDISHMKSQGIFLVRKAILLDTQLKCLRRIIDVYFGEV